MRKLILITLFAIIAALLPSTTCAQNDPTTIWYWATTPEGLVAYTADGQVNLIYAGPDFYNTAYSAARLSNATALLRDGEAFYWVDSTTARKIPAAPTAARLRPQVYHHPYVVLMETETLFPGAVLNLDTSEIIGLADNLVYFPRFLPDGITLRYVGVKILADGSLGPYTLWEQNLLTGELTQLAQVETYSFLISSLDGEQWWLADKAGQIATVGVTNVNYTEWLQTGQAEVYGDWIWQRDPACDANCTLNGYSLVDDATFTINLPDPMLDFPDKLMRLSDGSALFIGTTDLRRIWLQNPDGTLLELGEVDYMKTSGEYFSDDGQWAIAMGRTPEGDMTTRLWDLTKRAIVYEAPYLVFSYHLFVGDTVALYYDSQARALYWNGKAVALDGYESTLNQYPDNFFQILSGGRAFYEHPDGGISRFDAATESMTLLVPDGKHISVYNFQ